MTERNTNGGREDTLQCTLCAHGCRLKNGRRGLCGVRERRGANIVSLVYGRIVAEHLDPIEKKPLYHVLPGSSSYSIATLGCNFRCLHCQNASISQVGQGLDVEVSGVLRSPGDIVGSALATGCRSISYTYVEPTVFFEFAYDCCVAAVAAGLNNIFVSNGYMTVQTIDRLTPVLTAINIDLKSFSDAFYQKICGARLQPVLDAIGRFKERQVWVEVTTLIIPGVNDDDAELNRIATFLADIDKSIPWHVSGYHPSYRMTAPPPTSGAVLERARQIGLDRGLHHVYTGNRPGIGGEDTFCPGCGCTLISRRGYRIAANRINDGKCSGCGMAIAGVWT